MTTNKCFACRFWLEVPAQAKAAAGVLGLLQPRSGACHGFPPQLVGTPNGLAAVRVNTSEGDLACSLFSPSVMQ